MSLTIEDVVGNVVEVTLVTDTKIAGIVYTYNPKSGLLVLMDDFKDGTCKTRIIRTPYIKEFKLVDDGTKVLPGKLEAYATLPSMARSDGKDLFKHADDQFKNAKNSRLKYLSNLPAETPIAVVDTLLKIGRVYPEINWEPENNAIHISAEVFIIGEPDWSKPVAKAVEGSKEDALVKRVQALLDKK